MELIIQSIQVSILAMIVIFLVLSILIGIIQVMVHFLPYQNPQAPPAKASATPASGSSPEEDHIVAIHAALAHHLGRAPQDIHIGHITSL